MVQKIFNKILDSKIYPDETQDMVEAINKAYRANVIHFQEAEILIAEVVQYERLLQISALPSLQLALEANFSHPPDPLTIFRRWSNRPKP